MKNNIMSWFVRLIRLDMAYTADETDLSFYSRNAYKIDRLVDETKDIKKNKQRKEEV